MRDKTSIGADKLTLGLGRGATGSFVKSKSSQVNVANGV
jgi:hypothetical protein